MLVTPRRKPRTSSSLRIFVDRSLPQDDFARAFRHFEIKTWTLDEVFGSDPGDVAWIEMCGHYGLTAVMKNPTMHTVSEETNAIRRSRALVVGLGSTQLGKPSELMVFGRHLQNMRRWKTNPDGALWRIYHNTHIRDL